jgi:acetyl-CoA synthetase
MVHERFDGSVRELTWGELQDLSNQAAHLLDSHGVVRGDRVAVVLPPAPETAAIFFGTWKLGAILLSMSVLYGDDAIAHRLSDAEPTVLVTDEANAQRFSKQNVSVVALDAAALAAHPIEHDTADTAADDPAQLYYTSGTTGLAKGIVHAHRYVLAHEEFVYCHEVEDGERFHGMGEWAWAAGIAPLLGPWRLGALQCVYQREGGFDPRKQLDFLSRHDVTNVFTTPTAMRSMMSVEDAGTRYPCRFRRVCSAGEPLNPEAIRWFREQYGVTVLDYYGLTESYPLVANYPWLEVREGSMGRPMPGWDVQVLDEDEQPVPRGERGEICLRARSNPHYPLGYWRNEEAARETFGGEWFHSKDAAVMDDDGYIWYAGRADDVIISAGYRIGPFEVESACLEHPAVREAAAVAAPDELRGSIVKAFVVLAEGHEPSDELATEISQFVRTRLSQYAYPRRIEFVDDLPKTLTGKIRRVELRERELNV